MATQPAERLPPTGAAPSDVPCAGGCGRNLPRPADAGNRVVLCHSCWSRWLRDLLRLIRVVKEEG